MNIYVLLQAITQILATHGFKALLNRKINTALPALCIEVKKLWHLILEGL